jgi:GAF domain-containing protein
MSEDPDRQEPAAPFLRMAEAGHLQELFAATIRSIGHYLPLTRAVLVSVGYHHRDLLAVASWSDHSSSPGRLLSVRLPAENSLFSQVAAERSEFSDDYFGLFSGSSLEHRLLLEGLEGGSYIVHPIKIDSRVVGLIGLSSALPGTFIDFDSLDPLHTFAPLAMELSRLRSAERTISDVR